MDPGNTFRDITLNSAMTTGPAQWQRPQLSVSANQRVYLRGLVRRASGNMQNGDVLFTLPPGLCPPKNVGLVSCLAFILSAPNIFVDHNSWP